MMKTIKAMVTSKGQITIPKTIRDILQVDEGSVVEFYEMNGRVELKKAVSNTDRMIPLNLINVFLQNNKTIGIIGLTGSGKTHLTREIIDLSGCKNVSLEEPYSEIAPYLRQSRIMKYPVSCEREKSDLVVLNEIQSPLHLELDLSTTPAIINTHMGRKEGAAREFNNRTGIIPDILVVMENKEIKEIRLVKESHGEYEESLLYAS